MYNLEKSVQFSINIENVYTKEMERKGRNERTFVCWERKGRFIYPFHK